MDIIEVLQHLLGSDFIVKHLVFGFIDIYARKPKLDGGLKGIWLRWEYPILSYGSAIVENAEWNVCDSSFPGTIVDFIKSRFSGRALNHYENPEAGIHEC